MKLADRYILAELSGPFLLSAGGFILFMVANIIFLMVDQIVNRQVPALAVIEMVLLRIPAILVLTFPVAMLFASLLGLGRLSAGNEIMAMRTSGITFGRIALPIFAVAVILVIVTFLTNEKIAPWATHQSENIIKQILIRKAIPPVQPNVFIHGPNDSVYYVGSVDKDTQMFQHVMIYEPQDSPYPRMTTAERAHYDGDHLHLYNGSIHQYGPIGLTNYEVSFKEMVIPIAVDPQLFTAGDKSPFEMNAAELRRQIQNFKVAGMSTKSLATDYHFKLSLPFGAFVAGLIGIPLAVKFPRTGKFLGIGIAILLLFVYYCLFSVFRSLGLIGILPPLIAAWLPNLILGGTGIWLLLSEERIR